MGRMLGSYDSDELDRPDLNKCPDCGCFFAADHCPLCGKECPEHMRAGNRAAVKKRKHRTSGTGRVTFIQWYHSWWFIVIMMFLMPIVGILLLITSPHEKWKKMVFIAIAVVYTILSSFGIGSLISGITGLFDRPVDTSLTREEYVAACEEMSAEQYYRASGQYEDDFICIRLRVIDKAFNANDHYDSNVYYICESEEGSSYRILLRDCLIADEMNLIEGDIITVYGEGADDCAVYDHDDPNYNLIEGPCLNMAYVVLE